MGFIVRSWLIVSHGVSMHVVPCGDGTAIDTVAGRESVKWWLRRNAWPMTVMLGVHSKYTVAEVASERGFSISPVSEILVGIICKTSV